MRWVDGKCWLADCLEAMVYHVGREWHAEIYASDDVLWRSYGHATEAAAKSAVAAWIGKTVAQFGNALAAGEPRTFDDDGA